MRAGLEDAHEARAGRRCTRLPSGLKTVFCVQPGHPRPRGSRAGAAPRASCEKRSSTRSSNGGPHRGRCLDGRTETLNRIDVELRVGRRHGARADSARAGSEPPPSWSHAPPAAPLQRHLPSVPRATSLRSRCAARGAPNVSLCLACPALRFAASRFRFACSRLFSARTRSYGLLPLHDPPCPSAPARRIARPRDAPLSLRREPLRALSLRVRLRRMPLLHGLSALRERVCASTIISPARQPLRPRSPSNLRWRRAATARSRSRAARV